MNGFIFDLQRFATDPNATIYWQVGNGTAHFTDLASALRAATASTTVKLIGGNITETTNVNYPSTNNITIDLNGNRVTGTGTLTIPSGITATIKGSGTFQGFTGITNNGTLNINSGASISVSSITNNGALNVTSTTVNSSSITNKGNLNVSNNANINTSTITNDGNISVNNSRITGSNTGSLENNKSLTVDGATITLPITTVVDGTLTMNNNNTLTLAAGTKKYEFGNNKISVTSGNVTLTANKASGTSYGTGIVGVSGLGNSFTDENTHITYSASSSDVTFNYASDKTLTINGLANGRSFTVTNYTDDNPVTYTYTVTSNDLMMQTDDTLKIWKNPNSIILSPNGSLNPSTLNTDDFFAAHIISNNTLVMSSDALAKVGTDESSLIVDSTDHSKIYGKITKVSDGVYKLEKRVDGETDDKVYNYLTGGITINDGLTVQLTDEFTGVTITVNDATFKTTSDEAYTVTSSNDVVSIGGAKGVSLGTGSILSATEAQSVTSSGFVVSGYGYTAGGISDGVIITTDRVGDIEIGESFYVGNTKYTREEIGLTTTDEKGVKKVYVGELSDVNDYYDNFSVALTDFTSDNFSAFIQPQEHVLEIGGKNTVPAVVVDKEATDGATDIKKFAELKVDKTGSYTLTTIDGGYEDYFDFDKGANAINTISVAGGDTTIDYDLVNDGKVIVTKGNNNKNATFTVQSTTSGTFTVSGNKANPTVLNATEITLLGGSIFTDNNINQKVNFNGTGKSITVNKNANSINIAYDADTKTFTVTGKANDTFTLNGKEYVIANNSDGMTFIIDENGAITLSELKTVDGDVFTFDGVNYSVRGAGFIKDDNGYKIWSPETGLHTLTGGSVSYADFTNAENWTAVVTITGSDKSTTVPPSANFEGKAFLVDNESLQNIYGTITRNGGIYTIETVDSTDKLNHVDFYQAGSLSMGAGLTNVTIQSTAATIKVTDDAGDGYKLSLTEGAGALATVSDGEKFSLLNGAVQADSNVTVNVHDSIIAPDAGTVIEIAANSSDGTISGLDGGESFKIASAGYSMNGVVGLLNDNNMYLFNSKDGTVELSDIPKTDLWGKLISASALVIKDNTANALVVDNASNPATLYADYDQKSKTLRKSEGGTDWPVDSVITLDNTTVNFTRDFANKKIYGDQSRVAFTVTDDKNFTVTDVNTGATVNADNISLTGGTFSVTADNQIIRTDKGTVTSVKDHTVIVDGEKAFVDLISNNDSLNVNGATYTKEVVGFMDSSDNLLLGTGDATKIDLDSLTSASNGIWKKTDAVVNNVLTLPQSNGVDDWIIIDSDKTTQYGSLASDANGVISVDRTNTAFAINVTNSGATFTTEAGKFTVADGDAATISTAAAQLNQTAGKIALVDGRQSIFDGTNTIAADSLSTDNRIIVDMSNGNRIISALDTDETFIVDNVKYTLLSNGRFQRDSDSKVWNGNIVETSGGEIKVDDLLIETNWNSLTQIEADENNNLKIDGDDVSILANTGDKAFVVNNTDNKIIYGTLTKTADDSYKLSTDGKTDNAKLQSVTVTEDAPKIIFTDAFKELPINAGTVASFKVTASGTTFTVNYDATAPSITNATAVTLDKGTLALSDKNQIVTANNQTVNVANGIVNVNFDGDKTVTVDSIDKANDSVTVNDKAYTLTEGDKFTVKISDGKTTLEEINSGDKFTIGNDTFTVTDVGLSKKSGNSYSMWRGGTYEYEVTNLTGTDSQYWTNLIQTTADVTISTNATGILVDNLDKPTAIYGEITAGDSGTNKLIKYNGTDNTAPTSITVSGVSLNISDDFSTVEKVTLNNAAAVIFGNYTIGGTVDKVYLRTMTFTPNKDETFTLGTTADDTKSYTMKGAGLTNTTDTTDKTIWTVPNVTDYVLPANTWTKMLELTFENKLDLSTAPEAADYIVVSKDAEDRFANLTATANSYDFKQIDGASDTIQTIALGTDATVTTDFATTVTTGNGVYTVNGKEYTGNNLTIDVIEKTSTLFGGTVTITNGKSVTATADDTTITCTTADNGITATAVDGGWTQLGSLDEGDIFTVGDNDTYKVLANKVLAKLNGDKPVAICDTNISDGKTLAYSALSGFGTVIELGEDGTLDLTTNLNITKAFVVKHGDQTIKVAELDYDSSTGYSLSTTDSGILDELKGVTLGKLFPTFTTTIATTITTTDNGVYTVNGKSFAAQDVLTIVTDKDNDSTAFLTGGTVTLVKDAEVTTRRTDSNNIVQDETIKSTNGTVTVNAKDDVVTIAALDKADSFTVDTAAYVETSIGLATADKTKLLPDAKTSVTTADLLGDDWKNILAATGGAFTIESNTIATNGDSVIVADLADPTNSLRYGTLTKNINAYNLTLDNTANDEVPTAITLDNVKATLPAYCKDTTITAGGGTFKADVETEFTIDATSVTANNPMTFTNVNGIALSAGALTATPNTPAISVDGRTVTIKSGTATVGIDTNGKAYVGALNEGDSFDVNGIGYKMSTDGLFYSESGSQVENGYANGVFTMDDESTRKIIAVEGTLLDLTDQTEKAFVYNSLTNPTKKLAELDVSPAGEFTLTKSDNFSDNCIENVQLAAGKTIAVDFKTQINAPIGNVKVNGVSYIAAGDIVIDATVNGTETSSTLNSGTVTLNNATPSVNATLEDNPVEFENGNGISVTAENGKFIEISGLNPNDRFKYNTATYIQAAQGLINEQGQIAEDLGTNGNINVTELTATEWADVIAPTLKVLDISTSTNRALIYDNTTNPTTKLATLTINEGKLTLKGTEDATANITTVNIGADKTLTVDFATKVNANGNVTVNKQNFSGTNTLTLDSDGKTAKLFAGTVTLNTTYTSATATDKQTLTFKSGEFTAKAEDGSFTAIGALDAGDSFTWNGTTYTQSAQGLITDKTICEDLKGTTVDLADLETAQFVGVICPKDGTLNLTKQDNAANVYDNNTSPKTKLGTLTVADDGKLTLNGESSAPDAITTINIATTADLTVDFATTVSVSKDSNVTVNNQNYVGTIKLTIAATADSSTLTTGTVTLVKDASVTPTNRDTITATAGDGLIVNVENNTVTISGISDGDTFTVGENTYSMDGKYLYRIDENNDKRVYTGSVDVTGKNGITLDQLATDWGVLLAVTGDALNITANMEDFTDGITEALIVDNIETPTKIYGALSKTNEGYTLTKPATATDELTSIAVTNTAVTMDAAFANVPLTANDETTLSAVTLKDNKTKTFTLTATVTDSETDTPPTLSNDVTTFTLDEGSVTANANQTVTTGKNVITPKTGSSVIVDATGISGIDKDEEFTLNEKDYKLIDGVGLFNSTEKKLADKFADGTLPFNSTETPIIAPNAQQLDITAIAEGTTFVYDSDTDPKAKIGTVTKDNSKFTLNGETSAADKIETVNIAADSDLTVDFATAVKSSVGTVTVNTKAYNGTTDLTLDAKTADSSTLTTGTVTLAANEEVNTANNNIKAISTAAVEETITRGAENPAVISVTVDADGNVTIGELSTGDVFTVDGKEYKVSAIGPMNSDGKLWKGGTFTNGLTIEALNNGTNWTAVLAVTDGKLEVDTSTLTDNDEVIIVDNATDPTVSYGALTKTGDAYTVKAGDTALTSIAVDNIKLTVDGSMTTVPITANTDNTFTATPAQKSQPFTVDATSKVPALTDVKKITLTAGSISATVDQAVTVGDKTITPAKGTMVISAEKISGLEAGEEFTLNGDKYTVIEGVGLFNSTDKTLVDNFTNATFTFGSNETPVIAPIQNAVDIINVKATSIIVDSDTAPTKNIGTLTVADSKFTLKKSGAFENDITNVEIAAGSDLTVNFATTVSSTKGTVTVNDETYNGTTALTLNATETTSTLTTGTVTIAKDAYVTPTGKAKITATAGDGLTVNVAGDTVTVSGMNNGDTFTVGSDEYKITAIGPVNSANKLWTGSKLYTVGLTIDELADGTNWTKLLVVTNDSLTVNKDTLTDGETAIVVDNIINPAKSYGTLKNTADVYTLKASTDKLTSIVVTNTAVTMDADFATATFTANRDTTLSAVTLDNKATTFKLETTDSPTFSDDVTTFKLDNGSVTVKENQTVTSGTNTIKPTTGDVIVNATTISDIDTGDAFTINGKNYKCLDTADLYNLTDKTLVDNFANETFTLGDTETQVIVPTNGIVPLSEMTGNDAVVLSATDDTATKLGTLKKNGSAYSVDFATTVSAPLGTVTVNGKTYNATTALTLDTTADDSTLYIGSVTLANNESVSTSTDYTITVKEGNGLTVTAAADYEITIGGLNSGDIFTIDEIEYKVTDAALYRIDDNEEEIYNGEVNVIATGSITIDQLEERVWGSISKLENDTIVIDDSTLANNSSTQLTNADGSKVYGTLNRDRNGNYTLTKDNQVNTDATGITVDGVVVAIDSNYSTVPVTTINADDSQSTFTVTPDKNAQNFTVDATGNAPALTDVKEVELSAGALDAAINQPVELEDGTTITPTNGNMIISADGISGLSAGDKFTVTDTDGSADNYECIDGVGLFNSTAKTLVDDFTDGNFTFDSDETQIIAPNSNNQIDLDTIDDDTAFVYDSDTAPTTKLGTVTKDDTAYTVDFATAIKASAGIFSVNGQDYNATTDVIIDSDGTTSTLTSGTVELAANEEVTTTDGNVIKAIETAADEESDINAAEDSAVINVTVNADGTITIGELSTGDKFTVNGEQYKVTAIGPMNSDGDIWTGDNFTNGLTITALADENNWTPVLEVTDGNLVVNAETLTDGNEVILVDNLDDPTVSYGALTKDADGYTLAAGDNALTSIAIDGVTMNIDGSAADVPVTANEDNTFTVTPNNTRNPFTVDATEDIPALTDNVKEVALTAGSIAAAVKQPVTIGDDTVTPTVINGDMIIGVDNISGLTANDEFTLNGDKYKVIDGLGLYNSTDKTLVDDFTDGTFTYDSDATPLIALTNGVLNLGDVAATSIVVDNVTNPTTKLGTVTKDDTAYTVDFAATLKSSAGNVTVNGKDYNATTDVIIDSDGTTSTLTNGTVTLAANKSVTTTTNNTITAMAGDGLTVNADGTITIGELSTGDKFTVNDASYKVTAVGPMNSKGDIWTGDNFTNGLTITALADENNWTPVFEVTDGNLVVNAETLADNGEVILVDNLDDPTVSYGALTKDADGYTLAAGDNALTSIALDGVTMNIDGSAADVPVTANEDNTFTVTPNNTRNPFTVDATEDIPALTDNVKEVALTAGSIAAAVKQPVTIGDETVTATVINGDMIIGVDNISGLTANDEFTLNGDKYKVIDGLGLYNSTDKTLADNFADGTFTYDSDATPLIALTNGVLNLSDVAATSIVVDNVTNPTTKLGTVTKDDTAYTVDFAATLKSSAGNVTVNGKDYNATTDIIINSDGTTSTLTNGTVTLAANKSVTTTANNTTTAMAGDGLTVNVAGDTVTVSGMNNGDKFTVNGDEYTISALGPVNADDKLWTGSKDYTAGLTLEDLAEDANWTTLIAAPDGDLTVDKDTLENGESAIVVDDASNPTKTYGTLDKDADGTYSLNKDADDETLSSITDNGSVMEIDNDLADVPVTTVNSDGSESTFTVKPSSDKDSFTVDATGDVPKVSDADEVDINKGKISADGDIPIKPAEGAEDVDIAAGDGTHSIGDKEITIDGMGNDTVDFGTDDNGNLNSISGLNKGASVTIDGKTYTAPTDDAVLKYNDDDGWFFDGYTLDEYTVTVDRFGNVSVDEGVQFSKVVASGQTLDSRGNVKLAADIDETPVTVINKGNTALNISDNESLANNLGTTDGVKFSGASTAIANLDDVAGATFALNRNNSLIGGDATIISNANDNSVTIGDNVLDIDKAANVISPASTALELGAATYTLNGVELTVADNTAATLTDDGVAVDLISPITFDGMTLSTGGTATFDDSGNVSLTSGATATNANGKALTIEGTVTIDNKTVNTAAATNVTATANGLTVGNDTLNVTGDTDGYSVNIASNAINGLDEIGSTGGVTVSGLNNATIKTDKAGALTVDKTFNAPSNVTYTVTNGKLTAVTGADSISGDFSNGLNVDGTSYSITGGTATVNSDGNIETGAGTFGINGHTFTTNQPTTFTMNNSSVTGALLNDDGNFAVHQNESNFNLNDENVLTFSATRTPVSLGTDDGLVTEVRGLNGLINGLDNAIVYDVNTATINGTPLNISNSQVDVPVIDGAISSILGLDGGAIVTTAPNLTLATAGNGTFTFVNDIFNVTDTVDATVDFITDAQSRVVNIDGLSGLLSGSFDMVNVNGQPFATTSDEVTLATDGQDITAVLGLSNGTNIAGALSKAIMTLPEGSVTINGAPYTLAGDSSGVILSDDGTVISGLDKDATLTVGVADTYNINGERVVASEGQAFTVNEDGVYAINPNFMPITESTSASAILALGESSFYIDPTMTGLQAIGLSSGDNVALIDSPNAPTFVTTGDGQDSVVVRHGAEATVDVEDGSPVIVATNGKVTLENYDDNADIQTFDYSDIGNAIESNEIKFGDGTMTLGDAVISFGTNVASKGSTLADIIDATGDKQAVGFTHSDGGTLDTRNSDDSFILKGNYAQNSTDTQKSDGSSIAAGAGNDTVLVGADDTVDAGAGNNQIYITDPNLRDGGATIALTDGNNTVNGFNSGFGDDSDEIRVNDLSALEFGYGPAGLTMSSGNAQLTFNGLSASAATVTSADSLNPAAPYELKLTDGRNSRNVAIAQDGSDLSVPNDTDVDTFIGDGTTGLSFNEYTGPVAVNLNDARGSLNGSAVEFYGFDKVELGSGNATLTGEENANNTLIAGTGNGTIRSRSGDDLMQGNTSDEKAGKTTFFFAAGDGHDTIDGFEFADGTNANTADEVYIMPGAAVTSVEFVGDDVVIGFNGGTEDLLTITDAQDQEMIINGMLTKVDEDVIEFDGFTECYVGLGDKPTLTVSEGMGDVDIFLGDDEDTVYLGDIAVLDASRANGDRNILAGNDTDNLIIGGSGDNSIWGGDNFSNDTLVGGSGKNTFFFAQENGNDVIQNAHDGDVVDLTYLDAEDFAAVDITDKGITIDLTDGSHLDVQSTAAVEYKLGDGNTYVADHNIGEFSKKDE